MITPPPGGTLALFYAGPVVSENRRLRWSPRSRRMIADPEYRAFLRALTLDATLKRALTPTITEPVAVALFVCLPARMDSTAIVKPCLDALQAAAVIHNDSQVKQLLLSRAGSGPPGIGSISARLYPLHEYAPCSPCTVGDLPPLGRLAENIHTEDV